MDAIGVRYLGFRNLCKSMAGQARAIICRIDDYPRGHPVLLLLAGAQRNFLPPGRNHTIKFVGWLARRSYARRSRDYRFVNSVNSSVTGWPNFSRSLHYPINELKGITH